MCGCGVRDDKWNNKIIDRDLFRRRAVYRNDRSEGGVALSVGALVQLRRDGEVLHQPAVRLVQHRALRHAAALQDANVMDQQNSGVNCYSDVEQSLKFSKRPWPIPMIISIE